MKHIFAVGLLVNLLNLYLNGTSWSNLAGTLCVALALLISVEART
jgi:hypothetical protein